jgi:xanthine dehydrogenase YagS FAD-binding subunit
MRSFAYSRPRTTADAVRAVRAVSAGGASTRFLAGGTTLYDLMKLDVEVPARLVDITALPELAAVDTANPRELVFGALARMADVADDPVVKRDYPALSESLAKAASQQLRNMATLGGNLLQRTRCAYFRGGEPYACNKRAAGSGCAAIGGLDRGHAVLGGSEACIAVYPGDWAVALAAFDTVVDVTGPRGPRSIPLAAFHREPGNTPAIETSLARDELVLRIRVPKTPLGRASTYHKIRDRESYAFALASAAVALRMDGRTVREVRIALGGLATKPWRAREAERGLVGRTLTAETARAAGEAALHGARAGQHNGFKIELGIRTVADALLIAQGRA